MSNKCGILIIRFLKMGGGGQKTNMHPSLPICGVRDGEGGGQGEAEKTNIIVALGWVGLVAAGRSVVWFPPPSRRRSLRRGRRPSPIVDRRG